MIDVVDYALLSMKSEMVFFKFARVPRQLTSLHSVLHCELQNRLNEMDCGDMAVLF